MVEQPMPDPTFCPDGEPHEVPSHVRAENGWTTCARCGNPCQVTPL